MIQNMSLLSRRDTIKSLLETQIKEEDIIVSSTGKISRELYELEGLLGRKQNSFYMQGSMGCAVGIGLGIALNTDKQVYAITGDGALLMKLGSLATMAKANLPNLHIIVLNNNSHDSTGGQPTAFEEVRDFVAKYCQIIDVKKGSRFDLGRPKISPEEITNNFRRRFI